MWALYCICLDKWTIYSYRELSHCNSDRRYKLNSGKQPLTRNVITFFYCLWFLFVYIFSSLDCLDIPPFTHTLIKCSFVQHFLFIDQSQSFSTAVRRNLGFSLLPKDTLLCKIEEPGIEPGTLWVGVTHTSSWATATYMSGACCLSYRGFDGALIPVWSLSRTESLYWLR